MSFDFDAAVVAPFRMQPGLRRVPTGSPHLTPLFPGSRHQREKMAVLSHFAHQAFVQRAGFDPAPALAALNVHAALEHPDAWQWDGDTARATRLGVAVRGDDVHTFQAGVFGLGDEVSRCLAQLSPEWRLAGLLILAFVEDLAILDASDATVPWIAVTLPSHWAPEEKVGHHFSHIHGPVADNATLLRASEALARTVAGDERYERFVWNSTDEPSLHAHPARTPRERWVQFDPQRAWWRTERQTFLPVGEPRQAVFTIAVDVQPLTQAIDTPERASKAHAALASMSAAVIDYRGLTPVREPLLRWLSTQA